MWVGLPSLQQEICHVGLNRDNKWKIDVGLFKLCIAFRLLGNTLPNDILQCFNLQP